MYPFYHMRGVSHYDNAPCVISVMTRDEAHRIAQAVTHALPFADQARLKGIDVIRRLHAGMLTLRLYFVSKVAEEPEPFIFSRAELIPTVDAPEPFYYRCSPCQRLIPPEEGEHCWKCGFKATRLTRSVQTRG